jgi:hypothetical protein
LRYDWKLGCCHLILKVECPHSQKRGFVNHSLCGYTVDETARHIADVSQNL